MKILINQIEATLTYNSSGFVYGYCWGGGKVAYSATKFKADTKEELIKLNNNALKNGSLDSGMGYESLIGAMLEINTTTTIEINNKPFWNEETEIISIGDLSDDDFDFLTECLFNM